MTSPKTLDELLERLRKAEQELEQELDRLLEEKSQQFQYHLERRKVVFEQNVRRWQKQYRTSLWGYIFQAPLLCILSAPLVYGMVVPLAFLDVCISVYQQVCFRIYRIPRVTRRDYLVVDRQHLAYLNPIEKLNCVYCGYANGLMAYCREITARTEQYWCPIKHARRTLDAHQHANHFLDYGDAEAWRTELNRVRSDCATTSKRRSD